jgi:hypothetical protein
MVNDVKSEHLTRIMSTGRKVPGQTAPHLAFSIDTDVYWHSLGRAKRSGEPVVTRNHSIVQVESAVKEDHSLSGVWAPTMKWAKKPPEKKTLGGAYQRSTARPSARPPFPWHAPARGRRMRRRFAQMEKYGQSLSQVSADR